jgi:hypothetical protein
MHVIEIIVTIKLVIEFRPFLRNIHDFTEKYLVFNVSKEFKNSVTCSV